MPAYATSPAVGKFVPLTVNEAAVAATSIAIGEVETAPLKMTLLLFVGTLPHDQLPALFQKFVPAALVHVQLVTAAFVE